MMNIQPHTQACGKRGLAPRRAGAARRPGFTLIEIMVSVLILAMLIGLLITGVRKAIQYSHATVDRETVHTIMMGASRFEQEFGFQVPLVRDRAVDPVRNHLTVEAIPLSQPTRNRVAVYIPNIPGSDTEGELEGEELPMIVSATNPFADYRYSERSIPIYLAGQLNYPLFGAPPTPANALPIDGVNGPGLFKPNKDGTFAIPASMAIPNPTAAASNRTVSKYDPFINLGGNSPKLFIDPDPAHPERVEVRDRKNVSIRYYRWAHEPPPGNPPLSALALLHVPLLVGREAGGVLGTPPPDRDLATSPALRGATFAIVAAGPDGFFGDEENDATAPVGSPARDALDRMMSAAGFSPGDVANIITARIRVERDNIVEVAQ